MVRGIFRGLLRQRKLAPECRKRAAIFQAASQGLTYVRKSFPIQEPHSEQKWHSRRGSGPLGRQFPVRVVHLMCHLHQHPFGASASDEHQGFLRFTPTPQVVDCDFLHTLLRQFYRDRTAESTRASGDECNVERYFHGVDPAGWQAATPVSGGKRKGPGKSPYGEVGVFVASMPRSYPLICFAVATNSSVPARKLATSREPKRRSRPSPDVRATR
jgi:hypothetical protein